MRNLNLHLTRRLGGSSLPGGVALPAKTHPEAFSSAPPKRGLDPPSCLHQPTLGVKILIGVQYSDTD